MSARKGAGKVVCIRSSEDSTLPPSTPSANSSGRQSIEKTRATGAPMPQSKSVREQIVHQWAFQEKRMFNLSEAYGNKPGRIRLEEIERFLQNSYVQLKLENFELRRRLSVFMNQQQKAA